MALEIQMENYVNQKQKINIEKLEKLKKTFQGMEDQGANTLMVVFLY